MSRYYVRILCNDKKVRTYGGSIKDILRELERYNITHYEEFIIRANRPKEDAKKLWLDFICSNLDTETMDNLLHNEDPNLELSINIEFELVKRRSKDKIVISRSPILKIWKNNRELQKYIPLIVHFDNIIVQFYEPKVLSSIQPYPQFVYTTYPMIDKHHGENGIEGEVSPDAMPLVAGGQLAVKPINVEIK